MTSKSNNHIIQYIWNTQTALIQSLFSNKDKVKHHSRVIYRGIWSCGADNIGETIRNSEIG